MFRGIALLILVACLGCNSNDGPIPVSGTVKGAGGAVISFESGTVIFQPVSAGKPANGAVDPSGEFKMTTVSPNDGVHPGIYKVAVQLWKNYRNQELAVPKAYGDPATTPLEVTVDADHDHFDLVIEK
ncbi:hypothetical protein [Lacipirellula parvula]|uniref:Carboxypeptidase regulatory-like domain-containing protein n=1 Tax=Lacipirellula parvula TaxID=2650471 RepID=A0A5K7XDN1_9BACT|nr:hypothetical protein [Lacipirellula parvula]BBO32423.1 hypothetical protein PLANPX_2035 [Lacipirellula parvula]